VGKLMTNDQYNNELKIYLDTNKNTLFDLGWFLIDINQLLIICSMAENKKFDYINRNLSNPNYLSSRPRIKEHSEGYKIKHIRNGSIELIVVGVGALATIIMPILAVYVQEKLGKYNERITFSIESSEYYKVSEIIDSFRYSQGFNEPKNLNSLFESLLRKGYNVQAISDNMYDITKTLDKYCNHMVKIIYKNRRLG
jgi:hypothetical protein